MNTCVCDLEWIAQIYILLAIFGNFLCGNLSFYCVFVYGLPLFVSLYSQSAVPSFSFFYYILV